MCKLFHSFLSLFLVLLATDGIVYASGIQDALTGSHRMELGEKIPAEIDPQAVLAIAKDPQKMIHLNPLVTSSKQTSSSPITYEVTDQLLKHFKYPTTTYTATFQINPDGMKTVSKAPGGLVLTGTWAVAGGYLKETIDVTISNPITGIAWPFVKSEIEKSHGQLHTALFEQAKKAGVTNGGMADKKNSKLLGHRDLDLDDLDMLLGGMAMARRWFEEDNLEFDEW